MAIQSQAQIKPNEKPKEGYDSMEIRRTETDEQTGVYLIAEQGEKLVVLKGHFFGLTPDKLVGDKTEMGLAKLCNEFFEKGGRLSRESDLCTYDPDKNRIHSGILGYKAIDEYVLKGFINTYVKLANSKKKK